MTPIATWTATITLMAALGALPLGPVLAAGDGGGGGGGESGGAGGESTGGESTGGESAGGDAGGSSGGDAGGGGSGGDDGGEGGVRSGSAGTSGAGGSAISARTRDYRSAEARVRAGAYPEAIALLEGVLERDPRNAGAHNYMGYSLRKLGRFDEAHAAYSRALVLDPGHLGANEYIGELHLEMGRVDLAKERLASLDNLCPFGCEQHADLKRMIESYVEERYLSGVSLSLGDSVALGRSRQGAGAVRAVRKKGGQVVFAVEPIDWPADLAGAFATGSSAIPGGSAVVRYDAGETTNVRANFDWGAFDAVALHFERRFGPPFELREREIASPGKAKRANPTAVWRSVDPETKRVTTLEVRTFDDARPGFPDTRLGVVLLYRDDSLPIFPELSSLDLMMMR